MRVDEAVKQIKRTGKRGFVAVNVDLLLYGNDVTETEGAVESRLAVIGEIDSMLSTHPDVIGSMAFGSDTRWRFDGEKPRVEFSAFRRFRTYPKSTRERAVADSFFEAIQTQIMQRMQTL